MLQHDEYLRACLIGLRQALAASSASLYLPELSAATASLLIHEGEAAAITELSSPARAAELTSTLRARLADRPLAESHQATMLASTDRDGRLICIPSNWLLRAVTPGDQGTPDHDRRRLDTPRGLATTLPVAVIGLRLQPGTALLSALPEPVAIPLRSPRGEADDSWRWLLALTGSISEFSQQVAGVLKDPLSRLAGRTELQANLDSVLAEAATSQLPTTLLLLNPDEFTDVNERFGREAGDRVIREVAERLTTCYRRSDQVARYGGAVFAVVLPGTSSEAGRSLAEKGLDQLSSGPFLDGAVRLGFSVGAATVEPWEDRDDRALDFIRRADQALHAAKRAGGGHVAAWREAWAQAEIGNLDRLSGIFTGNITKDYRNMVLLLDTVSILASFPDYAELAARVVDRLRSTFKADRVGIFRGVGKGSELVMGLTRRPDPDGPKSTDALRLTPAQRELVEGAQRDLKASKESLPAGDTADSPTSLSCLAAPIVIDRRCLGCIYIDGDADSLALDESDLMLVKALASQLAVAADRAQLAEQERRRQEEERERMRSELRELRQALQSARLSYRSPEMESVLALVRRVAPTDATVLITGESGTGKELLARAIHEASPRRKKPLRVVDCASIPPSLMETELFGHEKGAYTGADRRKIGRLAEADGGTLLLDEIGELPLELQGKLLRFVQERQFTPVGGNETRLVDVRVLAATNRDLAADVGSGQFRADLYHRLNVVRIAIPPLRQRPADILFLAQHFLEVYSLLYRKSSARITPEAEALLLQLPWPGNVRELQNRMMRAVIMCEGQEIGVAELALSETDRAVAVLDDAETAVQPWDTATESGDAAGPAAASPPAALADGNPWDALRVALAHEVSTAAAAPTDDPPALGRWLADDLVLEGHAAAGAVHRRGALRLGLPETTYRRRLERAEELLESRRAMRSQSWPEVRSIIKQILASRPGGASEDLARRAQDLLLREIAARFRGDAKRGAALLGVTPPTYRRRLSSLE